MIFRYALKTILLPSVFLRREQPHGIFFLIYHRASGTLPYELDIPFSTFERQMRFLADSFDVISYDSAIASLESGEQTRKDAVVLTFDDGFSDFHTKAFPLLKELSLPATLFVSTGFVEGKSHNPLSIPLPDNIEPVSWQMLKEMHDSGFVTIGAHSHSHREFTGMSPQEVRNDLEQSNALFHENLGFVPRHFAYPRAKFDEKAESVVRKFYESAAISSGAKALGKHFDRYRIPRVPIRRSDAFFFFKAKVRNRLFGEEHAYDFLRSSIGK